ncbi:hypothetical protein ACFYY2_12135 [Streptomyces sp. NPDC001822]|uniref:hypothetical protein n=1 Tax=Streptomyces sp. NPDC001822 TaxID=3364614 RepID=UPI003692050A
MKNIAVGIIPEDLVNLVVTVEWTPEISDYTVTLLTSEGEPMAGQVYTLKAKDPIGYTPEPSDLDGLVMRGLEHVLAFPARLTRSLALFAHFEWHNPAQMSNKDRAKYGAAA